MENGSNNILLAFYGDDFTGSTDALEWLSKAGAKTVLFIAPPLPEQLAQYEGLQAYGVAGNTRAMNPADMEKTLAAAFTQLKASGARHIHYKVCSTFDSSPSIGSIGKAIDTGMQVLGNPFTPLLVAAPALGRHCVFGNLFARMGTAGAGSIYRLDRHPSMSKHPVTPADESDLRLHLAKQTTKQIALLDILQLSKPLPELRATAEALIASNAEILLIDALYQEQLLPIGALLEVWSRRGLLFSVGSSGVEMALGQYWNKNNILNTVSDWPSPDRKSPLLVICGSCSPVTARQVAWAMANGFEEVVLDVAAVRNNDEAAIASATIAARGPLQRGQSVIIHTNGFSGSNDNLPSQQLGTALGAIARALAAEQLYQRLVVAGGDTSSYAARAMGIESVEMIAALVPGAPLCKATATGSPLHGMEVNFKGGQVGAENYFGVLLEGRRNE
jgi:uncharacterized protein YgbK (DUF1537 family)